ncbi:retrovirus-related Pol polyprotein from transposon TNT 1-94 [Trichonephila clavipes]|nr:retrovirus-related Pol polyprotein from transposon TNT 1-94 [Trichonephila clavipes]
MLSVIQEYVATSKNKNVHGLPELSGLTENCIPCKLAKSRRVSFKPIDSDYADNRDDQVSIGGYILLVDETPISSRTFKQKCISLSTMEAEFVTNRSSERTDLAKYVLENEFLKLELNDCLLLCDNQATISFSNSSFENHKTNIFMLGTFSTPLNNTVATVDEWLRYRIMAGLVTSLSTVPRKSCRVGEAMHIKSVESSNILPLVWYFYCSSPKEPTVGLLNPLRYKTVVPRVKPHVTCKFQVTSPLTIEHKDHKFILGEVLRLAGMWEVDLENRCVDDQSN